MSCSGKNFKRTLQDRMSDIHSIGHAQPVKDMPVDKGHSAIFAFKTR